MRNRSIRKDSGRGLIHARSALNGKKKDNEKNNERLSAHSGKHGRDSAYQDEMPARSGKLPDSVTGQKKHKADHRHLQHDVGTGGLLGSEKFTERQDTECVSDTKMPDKFENVVLSYSVELDDSYVDWLLNEMTDETVEPLIELSSRLELLTADINSLSGSIFSIMEPDDFTGDGVTEPLAVDLAVASSDESEVTFL